MKRALSGELPKLTRQQTDGFLQAKERNASLTDRRYGSNVIDSFQLDDEGSGAFEIFRYDFDAPATTGLAGGGVLIDSYAAWIHQTTGIPEPGSALLWALSAGWWMCRRKRSGDR
jgi:hypothetical protein